MHFLRTGQFETAETFLSVSSYLSTRNANLTASMIQESDVTISQEHRAQFMDLHRIMTSLRQGDINSALECVPFSYGLLAPSSHN